MKANQQVPVLWMVVGDPVSWEKSPGKHFGMKTFKNMKKLEDQDGRGLTAVPVLWLEVSNSSRQNTSSQSPRLLLKGKTAVRILSDTNADLLCHRVSHYMESREFAQRVALMLGSTVESWWDEEIARQAKAIRDSWSDDELSKRACPNDRVQRAQTPQIEPGYAPDLSYMQDGE